jgi:acetyl esterase/lipase
MKMGLDSARQADFDARVKTCMNSTAVLCLIAIGLLRSSASEPAKVVALWPGAAPGETVDVGEEHDTTKPSEGLIQGKRVIRLGNVSKPTISVYRPPKALDTGAAVLVCPGGGYYILAMDLEGTEICEWLNSIGVTGVLLKYRVPLRAGQEKTALAAFQDAERAMSLLRSHAKEWGIDSKRIGVLGFSAGGHLAAVLSNSFDRRSYPAIDAIDQTSCRPDFSILIYPAYLTAKVQTDKPVQELNVTSNTPPAFLVMAEDDPVHVENVLYYGLALHKANVPFELHVYPNGGHGYGLRPSEALVTTWPQRAADWMRSRGWLERK